MKSLGSRLPVLLALPLLAGCGTIFEGFSIIPPEEPVRPWVIVDVESKLAAPRSGDPTVLPLLADVPRSSVNLVVVQDRVQPHYHKKSDETVFILEGEGDLLLNREWLRVRAGTLIHIPIQVPHAFVNRAPGGTTAISTFTPPLVEGDRVDLKEQPGSP